MASYFIALGDSITAGYGVNGRSFAVLYYTYLHSVNPNLRFINFGLNGLTTEGLTQILSANGDLRNLLTQAELITVTIGSNDLLHAAGAFLRGIAPNVSVTLSYIDRNLDLTGSKIRSLNSKAIIKIGTIYNPLLAGLFFQYAGSAQSIINQANKIIVHYAKRYGFKVIPIDKAFRGREQLVIGPDQIHPNPLGHKLIAETASG